MTLGVDVTTRTAPPARGPLTSTGTLFLAMGGANPGDAYGIDAGPVLLRSIDDFVFNVGERVDNPEAYDYLDTFFHEGGQRAYFVVFAAGAAAGTAVTYEDALGMFGPELGPGQVKVVGIGAAADADLVAAVFGHAAANNRFGVVDAEVGDTSGARRHRPCRRQRRVRHGVRPLAVGPGSGRHDRRRCSRCPAVGRCCGADEPRRRAR
jgi:hypothetical protein